MLESAPSTTSSFQGHRLFSEVLVSLTKSLALDLADLASRTATSAPADGG